MRMYAVVLLLLLVTGCSTILGPRDPGVEMHTDRPVYRTGEEITLSVRNIDSDTLVYDGARCAFLERIEDGEWHQIGTIERCIIIAYPTARIAPGETQTAGFEADDRFEVGAQHRFFVVISPVGRRSDQTVRYSNPFEVIE
jgi:hypothetical protein